MHLLVFETRTLKLKAETEAQVARLKWRRWQPADGSELVPLAVAVFVGESVRVRGVLLRGVGHLRAAILELAELLAALHRRHLRASDLRDGRGGLRVGARHSRGAGDRLRGALRRLSASAFADCT